MREIQTIMEILVFAGAVIGLYVKQQIKNKEFEMRLKSVEKQDDNISRKLDNIAEDITEIKLELQNKQNRH